jgi:prophage antirepressor-like protein
MRRANWRELEGRHYAFKGRTIQVVEDVDGRRWVRLADIRAITGHTASDAALQVTYSTGWRLLGRPPLPHLSDEALLTHIAKERTPEAGRLRQWIEREIVFPARRERERRGIRPAALDVR